MLLERSEALSLRPSFARRSGLRRAGTKAGARVGNPDEYEIVLCLYFSKQTGVNFSIRVYFP